jgi:hypothetical protein
MLGLGHQQLPAFASVLLGDVRLLLSGQGASGSSNGHRVTHVCSRGLEHGVADPEPVASDSVRLKRCLKSRGRHHLRADT